MHEELSDEDRITLVILLVNCTQKQNLLHLALWQKGNHRWTECQNFIQVWMWGGKAQGVGAQAFPNLDEENQEQFIQSLRLKSL